MDASNQLGKDTTGIYLSERLVASAGTANKLYSYIIYLLVCGVKYGSFVLSISCSLYMVVVSKSEKTKKTQ